MENKVPNRLKPKPGIAEAIHAEIGNGASWETDQHSFLLRSPDPTKELDHKLLDFETIPAITNGSEKTDIVIFKDEIVAEVYPTEILSAIDKGILSKPGDVPVPEAFIPITPKKGKEKPERKKKPKTHDPEPQNETTSPINEAEDDKQLKPLKPSKLVRKAAKSVRRQEEDEKKAASPELTLTESTLSPYTQWLKGLKGSEYVHPYDDDFAFVQGSGPAKEGISETFADLLASQGYKERAVEMYLKLMEKYPEKSGFFAAKIEALQ